MDLAIGGASVVVTLIIVVVVVVITLVTTVIGLAFPAWFVWKIFQASQANQELLRTGLPAPAKILAIATTGTTMNDSPQVRITLRVEPSDRPPFEAVATRFVSIVEIPRVQPGCAVQVRFDAANPTRVAIESLG